MVHNHSPVREEKAMNQPSLPPTTHLDFITIDDRPDARCSVCRHVEAGEHVFAYCERCGRAVHWWCHRALLLTPGEPRRSRK
jgi:hypothetical protein